MATVERVSPEGLEKKKKAIEASMKLRQNSSIRGVLTMWVTICYGAYLLVGLQLLLNAIFGSSLFPQQLATWHSSVYIWAFGNLIHGFLTYREWFLAYAVATAALVVAVEEFGLQTGMVFGDYYFTDNLGTRLVTGNLPLVVVGLWLCLLYPTAQLVSALVMGTPDGWPTSRWWRGPAVMAFFAAVATVGFDLFSELVGVTAGHKMWAIAAFESPSDCSAIDFSPDWVFPQVATGGSLLFFGKVPLQNFVGWFGTSFVAHLFFFTLRQKFAAVQKDPLWIAYVCSYNAARWKVCLFFFDV
eukprot:INCI17167.1.p1 GENE.INCI17167.1~~INCI17167.1.p1  ORF type:complete len:300 (+),score=36.07 INCI17167.1:128-1027(+)